MGKGLIFILFLIFSANAFALDCSKYNFPKNLCSARLKSNQDYFGPFYRDGNVFRTVGCREGKDRGSKNENCNSDKCEVISFINVCGVQTFTRDLLPVMAEGGESEIILMTLEKYPAIMTQLDPSVTFWSEYFSDKKVFYSKEPHLELKLALLDKGFVPEVPTYKAILEKSLEREMKDNPALKKRFEESKFKKDLDQAKQDVSWVNNLKQSSSLNPEKLSDKDFSRISANYLNSSVNSRDLLTKKVELVSIGQSVHAASPCYSEVEMSDVINQKTMSPQVELFLSSQIDCLNIEGKASTLNLMDRLQSSGLLTRELFDKLYTKLAKEDALTEEDILVISRAISLFDTETALRLSLLEFDAIEKFALDLKPEDCPKDSKAHQILLGLHRKLITDQTDDFFKKLLDPKVSFAELEKIYTQKIWITLIPLKVGALIMEPLLLYGREDLLQKSGRSL